MTPEDDMPDPGTGRSQATARRRAMRFGIWSLAVAGLAGLAAALAVVLLIGQTMAAPDWLRERIAARIEQTLPGLRIAFGDIEMVVNRGWRPRARLRDVVLTDAEGRPVLRLADAEASLAMRPLLRGKVQPKQVRLAGAQADLERNADGGFSLALGGGDATLQAERGVAQLIETVDAAFGQPLLSALTLVEVFDVSLRYEDAVSGRAWSVDSGEARLEREGDNLRISGGMSLLSGRAYASTIEVNYSSAIGSTAAEFGITLTDVPARDFASQAVALSFLDVLRAPLSGALRGSVTETGLFGPLNATLTIGPGVLQPNDRTRPIPFASARTYLTFDPAQQLITFDEISVTSDWVTALAEGQTYLGGLDSGLLTDLIGQLRLTQISLNPDGLYDAPVELRGAAADFRLRLSPFDLRLGQVWINDDGNRLLLSGDLSAEADGWRLRLDGEVSALTPERLIALWPERAVPGTRAWVARNLSGGTLSDLNFALRLDPGARPDVYLDFDYADTDIVFMRTMPPITGASGQASLFRNRFVTTATAGQVVPDEGGPVDVAGTSFIVPDVGARGATPAVVRLMGRGSITSVLSLLNRPPLSLLDKPGLPVTLADGLVSFGGNLAVPLQPDVRLPDVEFFVDALATDVVSEALVPGRRLAAPQMRIKADQTRVRIDGAGTLSGAPFEGTWTQPIGQPQAGSRVEGRLEITPEGLESFDIGLPPEMVRGQGWGDFALDLAPGAPPRLRLESALTGLALSLPELGWSKPAAEAGALSLTARLGPEPQVEALRLDASGLLAEGSVRLAAGGGLEAAEFTRFRVGDWLDVSGRLVGRGAGTAPAIRVEGGVLDLRRATFGGSAAGSDPPRGPDALVARLDRLQITDTIALNGFSGQFALAGGLDGAFQGRINGATPVSGRVLPQDGRSAVRITASDAGGVLRDAGILRQATGGDFGMTLRPVGEPGTFEGIVQVADTRVRDAPAMAALLNAISVIGLLDELSGQGIVFSEVEARFRLTPSRITLHESRATGPSMGLTMDGVYDVPGQMLTMQGVISPVYVLNQIGGLLAPRRGEGLFGFNYRLTGSAAAPSVVVNPLSGLAPGFFREIFRAPEPPPVAGAPAGPPVDAPATAPADAPTAPGEDPAASPGTGGDR